MNRYFAVAIAAVLLTGALPAHAQATRTWVSGVGDDANPCSRTAPCKTFAGAISKTLGGGEINCLDPGGFGALTITKSITIDCSGTYGSVLNPAVTGLLVNDAGTATPNTVEVIVRGLSIDGAGTSPGINGIRFVSGRSLVLENILVQNENGGNGISIQPAGNAEFYAENVTVTDGATGILVQPTGANGTVRGVLRNVRAQNNSNAGLQVNTAGNTGQGITLTISKSSLTGNANGISVNAPPGPTAVFMMVTDSDIAHNTSAGITASGSNAVLRVGRSSITGNITGISIGSSAIVNTYGTNQLDGNFADGSFTLPAIPQE